MVIQGGSSHLLLRHLRLVMIRSAAGQQRSLLSSSAGRRVLQQAQAVPKQNRAGVLSRFISNGHGTSQLLKVPGKSTALSPGRILLNCKQHFHTTPRRFNPIIAIIARQAAKVASVLLGR